MFEDDYFNNLNYDNHFLAPNENFEEENQEIDLEQNDNTDNVINNSKKTMDRFLYNLTKNDNDKEYQDFMINRGKKQNIKRNNNIPNNLNLNKKNQFQQNINKIEMNNEYEMNNFNSNFNLINN